jgi:hypothetical protein
MGDWMLLQFSPQTAYPPSYQQIAFGSPSRIVVSPWNTAATITSDKVTCTQNETFGKTVSGGFVRSKFDDYTRGANTGSVFVYSKTLSSSSPWTQMTQLLTAISKDASTIVVGADLDDFSASILDSGTAYLFAMSTVWRRQKLLWNRIK